MGFRPQGFPNMWSPPPPPLPTNSQPEGQGRPLPFPHTLDHERRSMPADLILHNAKIATNTVPSFVDAVAVTDRKITATGTNGEILQLRGPGTEVIDGK